MDNNDRTIIIGPLVNTSQEHSGYSWIKFNGDSAFYDSNDELVEESHTRLTTQTHVDFDVVYLIKDAELFDELAEMIDGILGTSITPRYMKRIYHRR